MDKPLRLALVSAMLLMATPVMWVGHMSVRGELSSFAQPIADVVAGSILLFSGFVALLGLMVGLHHLDGGGRYE